MIETCVIEPARRSRQHLVNIMKSQPGFHCLGAYKNAAAAATRCSRRSPDVILMEMVYPGSDGIEGIRMLNTRFPDASVIVYTSDRTADHVLDAFWAGAAGYVIKFVGRTRILEAIREAHTGGAPMSKEIAALVVGTFQGGPTPNLTVREEEVLHLLCRGIDGPQIALDIGISEFTVRQHLKSVYKKLNVHSKSAAVAAAFHQRLAGVGYLVNTLMSAGPQRAGDDGSRSEA